MLLTVATFLTTAVNADLPPFDNDPVYETAGYDNYPRQSFRSSATYAPRVNVLKHSPECDDGLYTFLSVRGTMVSPQGPMILDNNGSLVWQREATWQTYNLEVQTYNGSDVLTFWEGDDSIGMGHGEGSYVILDQNYNMVKIVTAANGLRGDLHDFIITVNDTALMTVYEPRAIDCSSVQGPPEDCWIWDCLIQEVNIETGELLFEWRASHHHALAESYIDVFPQGERANPWDWYHINSIQKDDAGNYLVSARHTRTIIYINGSTGEIIWVLGGKRNMFKDLSNGGATDFAYQHDARWHMNHTAITIFDNAAQKRPNPSESELVKDYSRGMTIGVTLEPDNMTAILLGEYIDTIRTSSLSQGSMQIVPGSGNVLLGYGFNPVMTELDVNGTILCDTHFGPPPGFNQGQVQSYRTRKRSWVGKPLTKPDFFVDEDEGLAYVSWLGATQVKSWQVLESRTINDSYQSRKVLNEASKEGFETVIELNEIISRPWLSIAAIDADGGVLEISEPVLLTNTTISEEEEEPGYEEWLPSIDFTKSGYSRPMVLFIAFVSIVTVAFIGVFKYGFWRRKLRGYAVIGGEVLRGRARERMYQNEEFLLTDTTVGSHQS